ncbi:MAG: hypothetical protein K2X86_11080 [Cytophagaceae bacterium]|nr:hypothetical protein [Cytophagaceae bacterium]
MKKSIFGLLIGGMIVISCTSGNISNPATSQNTPSQNMERIGGSVSPRSEMENASNYAGSQTPGVSRDTILEPMRSYGQRSAPDASYSDVDGR